MDNRTIVIRTRKHTGIITSVAAFFSRKNIKVERMQCSENSCGEMLFTVTFPYGEGTGNIMPHLKKMYDVIDVFPCTGSAGAPFVFDSSNSCRDIYA